MLPGQIAFSVTANAMGARTIAFSVTANAMGARTIAFSVTANAMGARTIAFSVTANAMGARTSRSQSLRTRPPHGACFSGPRYEIQGRPYVQEPIHPRPIELHQIFR